MPGEIIRQSDPTDHGGKVLEGSMADSCHGKPISYIGQFEGRQCQANLAAGGVVAQRAFHAVPAKIEPGLSSCGNVHFLAPVLAHIGNLHVASLEAIAPWVAPRANITAAGRRRSRAFVR